MIMSSDQEIFDLTSFTRSCHDTTSGMESIVFPARPVVTSFFTSHLLKPDQLNPVYFIKFQPDWILALFLISFGLIAWIQVTYSKRLRQILLAPYSRRFLNQLIRDGNIINERISIALVIVYFTGISLFLYQINILIVHHPIYNLTGFPLYLTMALSLLIYWLVKILVIRVLGIIFKTSQATYEYILNIFILIMVSGILFLPLMVLTVYLKSIFLIYTCLIIFILLFIFRFIRGFIIGISVSRFSYLLLFVYLCSLEILPVIILAKLILSY
jgi:hypothetical protein